jgi:hypothetical protein
MLANQSMASGGGGADDSTIRLPRRSHAGTGMSSAKSHSSALNTTFSTVFGIINEKLINPNLRPPSNWTQNFSTTNLMSQH